MANGNPQIPPLPQGYTLDKPTDNAVPPLPEGFTLDQSKKKVSSDNSSKQQKPLGTPSSTPSTSPYLTPSMPNPNGLVKAGNIDLSKQPSVTNTEKGGQSTVFSFSKNFGDGKGEVLMTRVTPDGKFMSEQEAIDYYHKTGNNLGIFKTPQDANAYASQLHLDYQNGKITPLTDISEKDAVTKSQPIITYPYKAETDEDSNNLIQKAQQQLLTAQKLDAATTAAFPKPATVVGNQPLKTAMFAIDKSTELKEKALFKVNLALQKNPTDARALQIKADIHKSLGISDNQYAVTPTDVMGGAMGVPTQPANKQNLTQEEQQKEVNDAFAKMPAGVQQAALFNVRAYNGALNVLNGITQLALGAPVVGKSDITKGAENFFNYFKATEPTNVPDKGVMWLVDNIAGGMGSAIPFLASFAYGSGELSTAAKVAGIGDVGAETVGTIGTNLVLTYNDSYNEAEKAGVKGQLAKSEYAFGVGILGGMLFSALPALRQVKGLDSPTALSKYGVEDFAKALSDGKPVNEAVQKGLKATMAAVVNAAENSGVLTGIELTTKLNQAISNVNTGKHNFDVKLDPKEIGGNLVVNALTFAPFSAVKGLQTYQEANPLYKQALAQAGDNPEFYQGLLDKKLADGSITQEQYETGKNQIFKAKLIANQLPANTPINKVGDLTYHRLVVNEVGEKVKPLQQQIDEISAKQNLTSDDLLHLSNLKSQITQHENYLDKVVGKDVEYKGQIGTLKRDDEGNYVFDSGDGKEYILPLEDKNNPTESLEKLGVNVLPDLTNEQVQDAVKDREQVGMVFSKNGNQFFVSLANPKGENTVGDQVLLVGANGKMKEVEGMTDETKLGLINKFLEEQGLPKRDSITKVEQKEGKSVTTQQKISEPKTLEDATTKSKGTLKEGDQQTGLEEHRRTVPSRGTEKKDVTDNRNRGTDRTGTEKKETIDETTNALEDAAKKMGVRTPNDFGNSTGAALAEINSIAYLLSGELSEEEKTTLLKSIPSHFNKIESVLKVSAAPKPLHDLLKEIKDDFEKGKYDDVRRKTSDLKKGLDDWSYELNPKISVAEGAGVRHVAEAYHKAKSDGSNPDLVKAVEDILQKSEAKPKDEVAPTTKFSFDGEPLTPDHERFGKIAPLIEDANTTPQLKKKLKDIIAAYKAEPEYKAQAKDALDNIDKFSAEKKEKFSIKKKEKPAVVEKSPQRIKSAADVTAKLKELRDKGILVTADKSLLGKVKKVVGVKTKPVPMSDAEIEAQVKLLDAMADTWKQVTGRDDFYQTWLADIKEADPVELQKKGAVLFQAPESSPDFPKTNLTLAVFSDPGFKNFEGKSVSPEQIRALLKTRGKPIEKEIIERVLESDYFKGKNKFQYDYMKNAVNMLLLPLERLRTKAYSDYGVDYRMNGMDIGVYGGRDNMTSIILNSPVENGAVVHWSGEFTSANVQRKRWKLWYNKDFNTWLVTDKDATTMPQTEQEAQRIVGTVGSREACIQWLKEHVRPEARRELTKGMFGHLRMWFNRNDGIAFIPESQSDVFQTKKMETAAGEKRTAAQVILDHMGINYVSPDEVAKEKDRLQTEKKVKELSETDRILKFFGLTENYKDDNGVLQVMFTDKDGQIAFKQSFAHDWKSEAYFNKDTNPAEWNDAREQLVNSAFHQIRNNNPKTEYSGEENNHVSLIEPVTKKVLLEGDLAIEGVTKNPDGSLMNAREAYEARDNLMTAIATKRREWIDDRDTKVDEFYKEEDKINEERKKANEQVNLALWQYKKDKALAYFNEHFPKGSFQRQFIAYQNIFRDRLFLEARDIAAKEGMRHLAYPMPFTMAVSEYIKPKWKVQPKAEKRGSAEFEIAEHNGDNYLVGQTANFSEGDRFLVDGDRWWTLEVDDRDHTFEAIPVADLNTHYRDDYISDMARNDIDDAYYSVKRNVHSMEYIDSGDIATIRRKGYDYIADLLQTELDKKVEREREAATDNYYNFIQTKKSDWEEEQAKRKAAYDAFIEEKKKQEALKGQKLLFPKKQVYKNLSRFAKEYKGELPETEFPEDKYREEYINEGYVLPEDAGEDTTVSWDDISDELREEYERGYEGMSNYDLYGDHVYDDPRDSNIFYTIDTSENQQTFLQPDHENYPRPEPVGGEKPPEKKMLEPAETAEEPFTNRDTFKEQLDAEQKAVIANYEKEVANLMKKYKDGHVMRDKNGLDWFMIPIKEEHKDAPIIAFQKEGAQAKGAIDFLNDNKATVHLFEGADISTLVHEMSGHIGRRVLEKLAEHNDSFAKDYRTIKRWAGVKGDRWTAGSEEKFARGFERYLREGKAPSAPLQRVFSALKDWLVNVYKTIKGSPIEVKLNDDVRGIFDRLLSGEPPREEKPKAEAPTPPAEKKSVPTTEQKTPDTFEQNLRAKAESLKDVLKSKSQKELEARGIKISKAGIDTDKLIDFVVDAILKARELGRDVLEYMRDKYPKEWSDEDRKNAEQIANKEFSDVGVGGYENRPILKELMQSDISDEAKKVFEKKGIKYEPATNEEAKNLASEILKFSGETDAIKYAEDGRFSGRINSAIFSTTIDKLQEKERAAREAGDEAKADALARKWANIAVRYDKAEQKAQEFIGQTEDWQKEQAAKEGQSAEDKLKDALNFVALKEGLSGEDQYEMSIKKRDLTNFVQKQLTSYKGWDETFKNAANTLAEGAAKSGRTLKGEAESMVNKWYDKYFNDDGTPKKDFNPTDEELAIIAIHRLDVLDKIKSSAFDATNVEDADQMSRLADQNMKAELLLRPDVAGRSFAFRQAMFRATAEGQIELVRKSFSSMAGVDVPKTDEEFNNLSADQQKLIKPLYDAYKEYAAKVKELEKQLRDSSNKISEEEFNRRVDEAVKARLAEMRTRKYKRGEAIKKSLSQKGKEAADKLRQFKSDKLFGKGLQSNILAIPAAIYDGIIESAALLMEAGATLAESIKTVISRDDYKEYFSTDQSKEDFLNKLGDATVDYDEKQDAITKLKGFAEKENKTITKEISDSGAIKSIIHSYLGRAEPKDILDEATKEIKAILPEATREQVRDSYLNTGEFKKETKKQLNTEITQADHELKRISNLEKEIEDLKNKIEKDKKSKPERKKSQREIELEDERAKLLHRKQKTYEQVDAAAKKKWEQRRKNAETKLRRQEFEETPDNVEYKKSLEESAAQLQSKLAERKLKEAAGKWKDKNKAWYEKVYDRLRRFQVANLISSIIGIGKVGYSGLFKPLSDALTRTIGLPLRPLWKFLGINKALERQQYSSKAIVKSFRDSLVGMTGAKAEKRSQAIEKELNESLKNLNDAYSEAKRLIQEHGEDSEEYKNFESDQLADAKNRYRTALLNDQVNFVYRFISPNAWAQRLEILKHGSTDFEEAMGGYSKKYMKDQKSLIDKGLFALEIFSRLHSAIKDVSARQAFIEGYVKRMDKLLRENGGEPPTEAQMMGTIFNAYNNDYLAGKFQEQNQLAEWIRKQQTLGEVKGGVPSVVSKVTQALTPVLKIPLNILKEGVFKYTLGTPIAAGKIVLRISDALKLNPEQTQEGMTMMEKIRESMADLPPEQADQIVEYAQKGLVGLGLFLWGAYATANGSLVYGGAYEPEKARRKYKGADGKIHELDYGHIVINGHDIGKTWSAILSHYPPTMPILFGNSFTSAYKDDLVKVKTPKTKGDAVIDGISNFAKETWYDSPLRNLGDFSVESLYESFTTQMFLKSLSEQLDTDQNGNLIERKPTNALQEFEMRFGLRQLVPTKDEALKKIQQQKKEAAERAGQYRKNDKYYQTNPQ